MQFEQGNMYHIYNRGNNKQPIFFKRANYIYFLSKVQKYITSCSDLLCWTLMPNHFHFLVYANAKTCALIKHSPIEINGLTEGLRLLLSSYTKGIQKQESFTGNLFQQKTKSKCLLYGDSNYSTTVFHYIHQNAYKAHLVKKMEDWEFSSLRDYMNLRKNAGGEMFIESLCNIPLAYQMLEINPGRSLNAVSHISASEVDEIL